MRRELLRIRDASKKKGPKNVFSRIDIILSAMPNPLAFLAFMFLELEPLAVIRSPRYFSSSESSI